MLVSPLLAVALPFLVARAVALNFTVANGQIYTPGFAIVDAPQPGTPEGGDSLEVALDVSTDGKLQLPPYPKDDPSQIFNITIFLYSYTTGYNFTITNGTATAGNASLGDIMAQEPGSTVKHVHWTYPDCLVGNGQAEGNESARGVYNISIRQNFRLNNSNYYTIFDLPISVTNSVPDDIARPSCNSLNNPLLTPQELAGSANNLPALFAPGDATGIQTSSNSSGSGNGLGAATTLSWFGGAPWLCLGSILFAVAL